MEAHETIAGSPATTAPTAPPGSAGIVVGLGLWSVLVSCVAGYAVWRMETTRLTQELALRPPVAIVNGAEWALTAGDGATPQAQVQNGIQQFNEAVTKLADAGFLVVDARWVPAAPANVVVKTPRTEPSAARPSRTAPGDIRAGVPSGGAL